VVVDCCIAKASLELLNSTVFHYVNLSILLSAIIKGHFFYLSNSIDSRVYFSRECIISTTRIATSQRDEPLERKFVKDS